MSAKTFMQNNKPLMRTLWLLAFSVLAVVSNSAEKSSPHWPGFRGHGDSHSVARKLPLSWSATQNIAWRADLPGYGQSSPVVWGDRVFLTATEGANKERLYVLCYSLKSGKQLWRKEFAATFTQKDDKIVSKAAPTPAVDQQRLYVFFESGDLFGFDHQGNVQWQRKLADEYGGYKTNHGLGSSLALTERGVVTLVAHSGPSYLLAVDKQFGKNLWKVERAAAGGWSTPLVIEREGKQQILLSIGGEVSAYDAIAGNQLWRVAGLKGNNIPSPSVSGDWLIAGSSDKAMSVAVKLGGQGDVTNERVAWRASEATANFASPLIHQGRVYFVSKVGVAYCLDLATGQELWRERIGGECWASPLAANGRVYFFTNEGYSLVTEAGATFKQLAKNELPELDRIYGVAALEGALLLRSGRRLIKVQ